ncbi:amino acid permease [Candidatus Gracilibacteria bacterium]|nr:amino acid permease [Candidatus Gracilibacteria bacterium]
MKIFQPKRDINVFSATTLGLGALIGAGIFVLAGPALELAGANVILVYLLAGVSALLSAFTYSELASTYLEPGNEYAFGKNVIGDRFAFLLAWLLISGSTVACAVYALGFSEFVSSLLSVSSSLVAFGITFLVCLVNIMGVQKTARMEYYFTVILAGALLLFGGFLLYNGDFDNFSFSFSPTGIRKIFGGVNLVYISFFGFQVIASATEEIKEPRKISLGRYLRVCGLRSWSIWSG